MLVGFNARGLSDPSPRGGQRYTACLLEALSDHDEAEVRLFTERRSPVHATYQEVLAFPIVEEHARRVLWWEQVQLPRLLRRSRVAVFHAPAEAGLPATKVCPYVLTFHGVPDAGLCDLIAHGVLEGRLSDFIDDADRTGLRDRYLWARSVFFRALYLRRADRVITVSEFSRRELSTLVGVPLDKIRVVPEAAAPAFEKSMTGETVALVRQKYGVPDRYLIFVGGYDRHKNAVALVRLFGELRRTRPELALVLVGIGGPQNDCRAAASSGGLRENRDVFFLSRVPDPDLAALYRGALAFVTLAWHEGFCFPAVEAMSCGTAVVATSFGALPETVGDGGLLVDPRDDRSILSALGAVIDDGERRRNLAAAAHRRSTDFSWRKAAAATLDVYRELLANLRHARG